VSDSLRHLIETTSKMTAQMAEDINAALAAGLPPLDK
jgi:hypothetical protein